ncbi:MAG: DUF2752 domain-containing protein [Myxococcales bacterium]|nr:DUF2752 domain-containing protein [Myxococcales bacterium]
MTPASPTEDDLVEGGGDAGVSRPKTTPWRVIKAFLPLTIFGVLIALDFPLCPSKNLFGIPCPGCGLTRASEAMLVGDLWGMIRFHPLAPIITPVAVYSFFRATMVSAGLISIHKKDPLGKVPNFVWATIGVVLVGLWVVRLLGFAGGHPDGIHLEEGWIAQGFMFLANLLPG